MTVADSDAPARDTEAAKERAMTFAYADPPYFGCCKLYGHRHEPPFGCWDNIEAHIALIRMLVLAENGLTEWMPQVDGWALSASSSSLPAILALCPPKIRVAAWVKPFASFKPNVNPAYAWEPVIFAGGRKRDRTEPTVRDFHSENITLKKGLTGAKPPGFCRWVADLLGYRDGDELIDVFPGTGVMGAVLAQGRLA